MTALPDLRDQANESAFHGAARLRQASILSANRELSRNGPLGNAKAVPEHALTIRKPNLRPMPCNL